MDYINFLKRIYMVYEKSTLGYNEFINEKRTLNVRERQVLLLANGVRNIDDLEKFFKKDHLIETIQKLESHGFIQPFNIMLSSQHLKTNRSTFTTLPFFNAETATPPIPPTKFSAVKTILTTATDDYLGLMGRSIKERITKCDSEADLKNCISSWHMAMRDSKLGRESTDFLMEQIHQTLENNMQDTDFSMRQTH